MASSKPKDLSVYFAEDIHRHADALVDEWIERIVESATIRPARMLPKEAIRDHIPQVLRRIAEALRTRVDIRNVDGAIRSHARIRYDQGYDIEELFLEYQSLTRVVIHRMLVALERYPHPVEPTEVARIFARLTEGLTAISERTAGLYRQTEVRQQQELHLELEDYVRTISHELKQPLHAITAATGMLEQENRGHGDERQGDYLRIIRNGIERAVKLIDEIRTLALYERSQQSDDWAALTSSVSLVLSQMRMQAEEAGARIEVVRPLPDIDVDATRVEIVLINLLSNAIKYADPDKPERWARIEVEQSEPDEARLWAISVTDNGLGIPLEMQAQIFERHFRAHPDVGEGTGLGLAISRQIVTQVGGNIWFESEEGRGSTFTFTARGHLNDARPDVDTGSEEEAGTKGTLA
jgi:signal transduction histidine kinase